MKLCLLVSLPNMALKLQIKCAGSNYFHHRNCAACCMCFAYFLEEARERARQVNPQTSVPNPEEAVKGRLREEEEKNRKTRKSTRVKCAKRLCFWSYKSECQRS